MRVRAANEMGMGHAVQLDVVDIAAFSGDETPVFLAHHACANAFNAHDLFSQPEFWFPPFPSKFGGLELCRSFAVSRRGYSAACATFMRPAASSTDLTMLW